MSGIKSFVEALKKSERKEFLSLKSPHKIQIFLDKLEYGTEDMYRCPLRVLRDQKARCFDGALFATVALRRLGHRPLIVDLIPSKRDDDHILALYKVDECWGSVAKSNFAGLRFREPVYRTIRELVMSYFELYYNVAGEKTLRAYAVPLDLRGFDESDWLTTDEYLDRIAERLDKLRRVPIITRRMARRLSPVDERSYRAGLHGSVKAGLCRPPTKKKRS